jgi:hypothetical protein
MKPFLPLFVIALCIAAFQGLAADAARTQELVFTQAAGVQGNPLGCVLDSRLGYILPLVKKPGILWETTKIELGVQNDWTPTDDFIGARIVIEPIAFFDLTARMGFFVLYDLLTYGYFSMASPDEEYTTSISSDKESTTKYGWWLSLAPAIKLKIRKLILAHSFTLNRIQLDAEGYYLEMRTYTIHRTKDSNLCNDSYGLWEIRPVLMAGLTHRYLHVAGTSVKSQRLSAIGIVSPPTRRLKALRIIVTAGAYLDDPLFKHKPYAAALAMADIKISRK